MDINELVYFTIPFSRNASLMNSHILSVGIVLGIATSVFGGMLICGKTIIPCCCATGYFLYKGQQLLEQLELFTSMFFYVTLM